MWPVAPNPGMDWVRDMGGGARLEAWERERVWVKVCDDESGDVVRGRYGRSGEENDEEKDEEDEIGGE
jgi:hypothetical protein